MFDVDEDDDEDIYVYVDVEVDEDVDVVGRVDIKKAEMSETFFLSFLRPRKAMKRI
jgi:hypothetical protein